MCQENLVEVGMAEKTSDHVEPSDLHDEYEERYCAFIDILGFRQLIKRLDAGSARTSHIRSTLNTLHNPNFRNIPDADFRVQSISDAVALSTRVSPLGLYYLLLVIEGLGLQLIGQGFLIRGGVVKGRLFHDENVVFGRALVDAYELESRVVRFPRVMFRSDVASDFDLYCDKHPAYVGSSNLIRQAIDGPYYQHILRHLELIATGKKYSIAKPFPLASLWGDHVSSSYYDNCAEEIQKQFVASVDDPNIFEKWLWFADYWNSLLGVDPKVQRIDVPTSILKHRSPRRATARGDPT
jgi:hypothetical protein